MHKYSLIAVIVVLAFLASTFTVIGASNAITPQTGTVNYTVYDVYGSNSSLANPSTVMNIATVSGITVESLTGSSGSFSLDYGSYLVTFPSARNTVSLLGTVITNYTQYYLTVSSSTTSENFSIGVSETVLSTISVSMPGLVYLNLSTFSGFQFYSSSGSSSTASTFSAYVPVSYFFADVYSSGTTYSYLLKGSSSISLNPKALPVDIYGKVTNKTGSAINNFNITVIGKNSNYYVENFNGNPYSFAFNPVNVSYLVFSSPGYKPYQIAAPTSTGLHKQNVSLLSGSSNISYNYSIGANPDFLNLTVHFAVSNSTALPYFANSSVGSLYWQIKMDKLTTSSISTFLSNYGEKYTNSSFFLNGTNYNLSGSAFKIVSFTNSSLNAFVNLTYKTSGLSKVNLSNGFNVKLYAKSTEYSSGSLYFNYALNYNAPGMALSSPASAVKTFISPIVLRPQTSSGFISLVFSTPSNPSVNTSKLDLYWNGMNRYVDYMGNLSNGSPYFVVPLNDRIYFNASAGFFNPATNSNNYQDSLNFSWKIGSSYFTPVTTPAYNASYKFTSSGTYNVSLTFTSGSGRTNSTHFVVYAFNSTPTASLNVSYNAKILLPTSTLSNGSSKSFDVLQSKIMDFNANGSKLPIPSTSYYAPLSYYWVLPNYTTTGKNITNPSDVFSVPYIASHKNEVGYLNVISAAGITNVTMYMHVNDTTPPTPVVTLYNSTNAVISQPVAGKPVTFSANSSYDQYYGSSKNLTYSWAFLYSNGTVLKPGNANISMIAGGYNSTFIKVEFYTLSSLTVSLKATNPAGITAYSNNTLTQTVNSPYIVVKNVVMPKSLNSGSSATATINVTNNGTVAASSFYIDLLVNGKVVQSHTYGLINASQTESVKFSFTPPISGKVSFVFQAGNSSEPSFFAKDEAYSITKSVSPPTWETPVIIVGVIAVIVVIGLVYYRFSTRGTRQKKDTGNKQNIRLPGRKQ